MKVARKLDGIRRYQAARPPNTRLKMMEALDRMESGKVLRVGTSFRWTKATLAREAGVNINTVVKKDSNGKWLFPDVNNRFEILRTNSRNHSRPSAPSDATVLRLRAELKDAEEKNRKLAIEINRIGRQVLEERARVERAAHSERQNASLREEIARLSAELEQAQRRLSHLKLSRSKEGRK